MYHKSVSQLNKLKSGITLSLLANLIGNSNDETNFSHKLLLIDIQVSKTRKLLQMVNQLI